MNTPSYADEAVAHLCNSDPVLRQVIQQIGPFRMMLRRGRFQVLVRAILFQQLAGPAAHAIYKRFVSFFHPRAFPRPQDVLDTPDEHLRSLGLSRQKITYLKDLASHLVSGRLDLRRLSRLDDEAVIKELTQVRGIGRWTAEMFLMFNMGRPDVLPVDDLGFRNAVARVYRIGRMPKPAELLTLGERWRPYRTVAVWYLWQVLKEPTSKAGAGLSSKRNSKPLRQPLD